MAVLEPPGLPAMAGYDERSRETPLLVPNLRPLNVPSLAPGLAYC